MSQESFSLVEQDQWIWCLRIQTFWRRTDGLRIDTPWAHPSFTEINETSSAWYTTLRIITEAEPFTACQSLVQGFTSAGISSVSLSLTSILDLLKCSTHRWNCKVASALLSLCNNNNKMTISVIFLPSYIPAHPHIHTLGKPLSWYLYFEHWSIMFSSFESLLLFCHVSVTQINLSKTERLQLPQTMSAQNI